jgi:PIN domain nuclease of toxin-antitoxin system
MRFLLDSCAFLWLIGQRAALPARAKEAIAKADNACFLSTASLWEILVKYQAGRLEIDSRGVPPERFLIAQREAHDIASLPIEEAELAHLAVLPALHRDPFDRILICQAIEHGLTIVTPDPLIRRYPVKTLW